MVGGAGGEGVALLRNASGGWSAPVFYNFGAVTVGAQAGAEGGPIAFILMTDRGAQMLQEADNKFSLDANAGSTIVDWSAKTRGSAGPSDVVVWSDTKGLFAGGAVGVTDINWDDDENRAYYGSDMAARDILGGKTGTDRAESLRKALSPEHQPHRSYGCGAMAV